MLTRENANVCNFHSRLCRDFALRQIIKCLDSKQVRKSICHYRAFISSVCVSVLLLARGCPSCLLPGFFGHIQMHEILFSMLWKVSSAILNIFLQPPVDRSPTHPLHLQPTECISSKASCCHVLLWTATAVKRLKQTVHIFLFLKDFCITEHPPSENTVAVKECSWYATTLSKVLFPSRPLPGASRCFCQFIKPLFDHIKTLLRSRPAQEVSKTQHEKHNYTIHQNNELKQPII